MRSLFHDMWVSCEANISKLIKNEFDFHSSSVIDYMYHCCLVAKSCLTLCDPTDCSPPGFSVHGISQAGILEWAATASSRGSADPEFESAAPALAGGFFTTEPPERM